MRWQQHYCRFWKNSALFCDLKWPDLFNTNAPHTEGATGSADAGEHVFWNAVTGDALTLEDGIALGRRIWNLDNAIWVLQGRHRDMVHFAPYIYETKYEKNELFPFYMWPCRDESGKWAYTDLMGRSLDRKKFDEWKTIFYRLEGWDTRTGWPTRSTLEQAETRIRRRCARERRAGSGRRKSHELSRFRSQTKSWPGESWRRSPTRIASLPGASRRGWASPAAACAACRSCTSTLPPTTGRCPA